MKVKLEIKKQSAEQREVVKRALLLKEQLGYDSDSAFAREQLGKMSEGRWSKIRRDVYEGDLDATFDLLLQSINRMEVQISRLDMQSRVAKSLSGDYHLLPLFQGIEGAVNKAMSTTGRRRLVFCSLPTGGGKTATCEYLRKKYGATIINAALPSYRHSSMPFLKDLCRALRVDVPTRRMQLEEKVLAALNKQDGGLLCIDEGNNFGGAAIDTLKTILNLTTWRVAFFTTPQHFVHMMAWYWDRADQLLSRAVTIIEIDEIRDTDVKPFLQPFGLNGCLQESCKLVAEAANEFGHFELCDRIVELLTESRAQSLDDVRKAVRDARQRLRTPAMKANIARHAKRRGKAVAL